MNDIFNQMVASYAPTTKGEYTNATYEVMQKITLAALYRGGFFDKAVFYGGTCLRIFHNLPRFSEDMDFSLLDKDESFKLEDYFQSIQKEFQAVGRTVEINKKDKKNFGKVESSFLKDSTNVYDISFQTEKSIKIKIEIDTQPPLKFDSEQKLLLHPFSFMTRCMTLDNLYAGKMHALTFRAWKNRVKGRDWYDFEWYVRNGVKLNFEHLHQRILEFNDKDMTKEMFISALKERLATANIEQVKDEVRKFVMNPADLDIWSNDYFLQLADMITVTEDKTY